MSDNHPNIPENQPIPVLGTDLTDWFEKDREHVRRAEELLPANKSILFDALAAAGITSVTVNFDGYGDSGQIEDIEAKAGDAIVKLPDETIEIVDPIWGSAEIERQTHTIEEAIEHMAYAFLRQTHDGWENNDGAYGDFVFDVAERTITLDYNERYTSSENYTMNFEEAIMAHPFHHALSSAKKWGGTADDFIALHQWFDESKMITADFRHRALRHHAEGIFMLERFFGATITVSNGRVVPVRLIGEQHVREDLGFIPSFADWVQCIRPEPWMGRTLPLHQQVDPFAAKAS